MNVLNKYSWEMFNEIYLHVYFTKFIEKSVCGNISYDSFSHKTKFQTSLPQLYISLLLHHICR